MKEKEHKKQINVELEKEQFTVLDKLARQYRVSRSAIVKIALTEFEQRNLLLTETRQQ